MKMKMYMFEGSPEEISQVMKTIDPMNAVRVGAASVELKNRPPMPLSATKADVIEDDDEEKVFVTVDFARKAMTRIPLSEPLKKVLIALHEADPDWVSSADLYKASGYSGQQFAGLMGAFGRRMKHTDGFDPDAYFFDWEWDEEKNAWNYRLVDTVMEAMQIERIA